MYTRYAANVGWKVEVMSANENEIGGYKEVVLRIEGDNVHGALRLSPAATASSVCLPPKPRAASTPAPAPWPCRARRGRGYHPQPRRSAHRHFPRQRCRWSAHQQDRLRRARGSPAHRHRGRMPGRPQPAQQQGQGPAGAAGPHPGKERSERAAKEAAMRKGLIGSGDRSDRIRTYNFRKAA